MAMLPNLSGRCVALVTGASRGIGKGISLQLGEAGAAVYITGRNADELQSTAKDIADRGGKAHVVKVDHTKDNEVRALFDRIKAEQNGRLDLCVNNAYSAGEMLFTETLGRPFWEAPDDPAVAWDACNNVGLRNHFLCTVYASRLMVPRNSGLIVNVSSAAGLVYFLSVPYGIGKAACDRMAGDCAHELKGHGVAMVSLWPGPVKTEFSAEGVMNNDKVDELTKEMLSKGESTEFVGRAVAHLAADPKIMKKSGCVFMTSDLAREYGFKDIDGGMPGDPRSVKTQLRRMGWGWAAALVPNFVRAPLLSMHFVGYRFAGFKWLLDLLRV